MNKNIIKPKTLSFNYDVYVLIKDKQSELIAETGKYYQMVDITDLAIRAGINKVRLDNDGRLIISPIDEETNNINEWNPSEIEVMWGSGGFLMSIDEILDWIKKHGYEILDKNNDCILIRIGDAFGSDDGVGEVDIPISYILENKADFQSFKDIIEFVNSISDKMR